MQILRDARQEALAGELRELRQGLPPSQGKRSADLEAMITLAERSSAALSRDNFDPGHFTASGFVLSPEKSQLLLILHKKLGMWLQPGGHVEPTDRNLVEAAEREVLEETGLEVVEVEAPLFDWDVHAIPAHSGSPAHLHHDVRTVFVASQLDIRAGAEVSDARWFDLHFVAGAVDVLSDGIGTDESVRQVARRLVKEYGPQHSSK